jgi:cytochrome c biogenesis protein CcmG/thiol:disulfide interchange protein DsbE
MRLIAYSVAAVALVVVLVIGLSQAGGDDTGAPPAEPRSFDLDAARAELEGAPAPLAALHEQSNALLGADAFRATLKRLEGHPAVINKWASWCGPCRAEFPIFQQVATERGKEVAFLGLNARDARPAAEKFMTEFPLPFPSYEDKKEDIARDLRAAGPFPMTIFVDRRGKIEFVHAGQYSAAADLEADIDRYLGG